MFQSLVKSREPHTRQRLRSHRCLITRCFFDFNLPWSRPILLLALALLSTGSGRAGQPPDLYFYPNGHQFPDGSTLPSPQTVTVEDITTSFPTISQMNGVVLIVYWSALCRDSKNCDFSLLDQALDYWRARQKKVVLAVATMGFPIRAVVNGKAEIQNATPDWVLAQSGTYKARVRVLAQPKYAIGEIDAVYPDFRDAKFMDHVAALVRSLAARYDSNPTIAQFRIGTGILAEDNVPMSLSAPMAGYTEDMWLQYSRRVTALYLAAFHHTELEFDISRLPWVYAIGTAHDKAAVDEFVNYLLRNKVFLAFNGLESTDLARLRSPSPAPRDGIARSLSYLQMYKRTGGRNGLEAISTELDPKMADFDSVIETIKIVNPNRLVFMNVLPSAINYRLNGPNPQNSIIGILGSRQREILDKAEALLVQLGYR